MKSRLKRSLALMLLFAMLFACISCAGTSNDQTTTPESTTIQEPVTFLLNENVKIIRSVYYTDIDIVEAAQYIKSAIRATYGHIVKLSDDWYKESEGLIPNEYEILIGRTNRPQSQEAYDDLKSNDYMYSVESENVITICGGSSESTLEAAKKFCLDVLGYDGNEAKESNPTISAPMSYKYSATYDYENVTIGGKDIREFVVGVRNEKYVSYALPLVSSLAQYNGYNLKIKNIEDIDKNKEKNVIIVGAADIDGSHEKYLGSNTYLLSSKKNGDDLTVSLDFSNFDSAASAVSRFIDEIKVKKNGSSAEIILPSSDVRGYNFESSIPNWTLKNDKTTNIANGVTYIYQEYIDEKNKPYKAYILKIDPSKAYLYMGSSKDGYDYSLSGKTKQTVLGHINSAKENGIIPVAGINADFFAISSDYHPTGLAIKEGRVISSVGARPWCGYTYDGRFISASSSDYDNYAGTIRTAVGASDLIVHNGVPYELDIGTTFADTAHPRTLAGVAEDGTIILAVVDGRQSKVSNGAPLTRCAMLMISHGAIEAVNLDGGGSSCMLVLQGGSYKTVNSPSDGSLRKVYNSLLVVPKA